MMHALLLLLVALGAAPYAMNRTIHKTLVSAVADQITVTAECGAVDVFNRSSTLDVYVRLDGATPTVAGDDSYLVPPDQVQRFSPPAGGWVTDVRLISSGAAPYSVQCP